MNVEVIKKLILKNIKNSSNEFTRLFHGRGALYPSFEFFTLDKTNKILFATFFSKCDSTLEKEIFSFFKDLYETQEFSSIILQRRYLLKSPSEVLYGELSSSNVAIENNLKFELSFLENQNIGFFLDMKRGREFVKNNSKNKKVLNLFSYTCAFSVYAISAGASKVVNVDMSKQALTTGRNNHRINNLDTKNVQFMPHNILKSWNKIKNAGPYDLIIIDPPSFQKGSFAATKDYEKIIKRLSTLASENCLVLSCLNAPELDSSFILKQFNEFAKEFSFVQRLDNLESFKALNEEASLKSMVFSNYGNNQ